ncbi:hypothetical protein EV356DRAFT_119660 [Viridothelium virens]|uniref:Uncharacterized protein n=1 Tax=Viridothelium virens TaxID=1048519 RepID=A0A6A6HCA2_VIRVR|nr:hypothetical protein EV356DRAFT_119660 [Viridothelium virens]
MSDSGGLSILPGNFFLLLQPDDIWPVIVIDDIMTAELMHGKQPTADSTPVLAIGINQLHWAENDKLVEFPDPPPGGLEEIRRDTEHDPQRIRAFELAWQFQPIEYWKEVLSEQPDRRSAQKPQHRSVQPNRERLASPLSGESNDGSRGSAELTLPEDASSTSSRQLSTPPKSAPDLAACQPGPSAPRTNRTRGHGEMDITKEDDDELIFVHATSKEDIPMLPSLASTTSSKNKDLYDLALENERIRSRSMSKAQDSSSSGQHDYENSHCEKEEKVFSLPPHRLSTELCERIDWDAPDGIHLRLDDTDPKRFKKVELYLINGDWSPRLIDPQGSFPRLEPQPYSMKIRQEWIEDCAFVWVTAAKLDLGCLRRLVLEKLKLLTPYSDLGIVILARAALETYPRDGNNVDRVDMEMRELLADNIAHDHSAIESGFTASWLQDIMMKDISLSVAVAEKRERLRELDFSDDEETASDGDADDEKNEYCPETGTNPEREHSNGDPDDAETSFEDCMETETDDEEEFEDQLELVEKLGDPKFNDE